jgi:hypothetical protein
VAEISTRETSTGEVGFPVDSALETCVMETIIDRRMSVFFIGKDE